MKCYSLLKKSPIRAIINETEDLTIFEVNKSNLEIDELGVRGLAKDIALTLEHMENSTGGKIKISVVGELKAGKSTFINAIVEKEVAYTDVTEATAIVSEITYDKEEIIEFIHTDGKKKSCKDMDDLMEQMEKNAANPEYWKSFQSVSIGIEADILKNLILVDTPGLLTITKENEDATKGYIHQSDYIFWIINGKNLGDSSVNDAIEKVSSYGKPMIGIINKIDSAEELEEVEDYIHDIYDGIFEEIFFVSARNAWRGQGANKKKQWESSGMPDVIDLLYLIGKNVDENKEKSERESVIYQLRRELDFHKRMLESLRQRKQQYDGDMNILQELYTDIKNMIEKELKYWIGDFFKEEIKILDELNDQEYVDKFHQYTSAEYITSLIEDKYSELANQVFDQWKVVETRMAGLDSGGNIGSEDIVYDFSTTEDPNSIIDKRKEDGSAAGISGVKKGAKLGTLLAGYAAWLGPAASYVTFGSALLSWVPPLAIGGLVVGSIFHHIGVKSDKETQQVKKEQIESTYEEIRVFMKKNVYRELLKSLRMSSKYYYDKQCELAQSVVKQLGFDYTEPNYSIFIKSVEGYIQLLEDTIAELSEQNKTTFEEESYFS